MKKHITSAIIIFLLLAGCSSAPKNPGDIYSLRTQAETHLELGNREADRGNYETGLFMINESKRLSIITDDPGLLIRTSLSRGNVLFSLGMSEEAFVEWNFAGSEAERHGLKELAAVSRVHIVRGRLLSGEPAQALLEELNRELALIKNDKQYIAFTWLVIALTQRELRQYKEAEASVKRSLDIHEKEKSLEQAAYNWFLIGSIRSLSGNYDGAIQALNTAIELDRRIENSWGLASDWRALGDVYIKAGKKTEASSAYMRAAAIQRALGNEAEAERLEQKAQ